MSIARFVLFVEKPGQARYRWTLAHLPDIPLSHPTSLSPSRLHRLGAGIAYGMTDTGRVRQTNEDNFLIDEQLGLAMVADGMGGHRAGGIASASALEAVRLHLAASPSSADHDITIPAGLASQLSRIGSVDGAIAEQDISAFVTIFHALEFANRRLYAHNTANGYAQGEGMGTTLTGLWQSRSGGPLLVFHVGDSRLYRYRAGELALLTRDQSLYQRAVDAGIVDNLPARNMLLQAIGPTASISPAAHVEHIRPGDLYLLSSDGLHGKLPPEEIARVLSTANPDNIHRCCADLIALANRCDGKDNVTAVLLLCQ